MKQLKKFAAGVFLITVLCLSSITYADREQDFKTLLEWAEFKYLVFFSPESTVIKQQSPWIFTHYPETETYIGLKDNNEIWALGDVFGGLIKAGALSALLDFMANERATKGQCVYVPLISVDSRIVSQRTFNPNDELPDYDTIEETYIDVSETHYTVNEIFTPNENAPTASASVSTNTLNFTIEDQFVYISLIESIRTTEDETESTILTTEFLPTKLDRPEHDFCEGQTFTEPPIQITATLNGVPHIIDTESSEMVIEKIHETLETPAGTFLTVLVVSEDTSTLTKQWIDIRSGHIVRIEEYAINNETDNGTDTETDNGANPETNTETDGEILDEETGMRLQWVQQAVLIE